MLILFIHNGVIVSYLVMAQFMIVIISLKMIFVIIIENTSKEPSFLN